MTVITSFGLLLLIVTQLAVGSPVDVIQKINPPTDEENTLIPEEADVAVELTTLSDFGRKYSLQNVTNMTQGMKDLIDRTVNGEHGEFLRTRLGNEKFQEITIKLNNSISETDWMRREAEYLKGKRLKPHVTLLRRLIKRLSIAYQRLARSFQDLAASLRPASVGSTGFSEGVQIVFLKLSYGLSSFLFHKASDELDHDWRSLASLEPV